MFLSRVCVNLNNVHNIYSWKTDLLLLMVTHSKKNIIHASFHIT